MNAGVRRIAVTGLIGAHPLNLAQQLAERSLLSAYYTTLPVARTPAVPPELTHRHLVLLLGIYAVGKGWIPGNKSKLQHMWGYEFDRWIGRRLQPADVVHALPGCGLKLRRIAKSEFGALTVCDSGTSHERYQEQLLEEEAGIWGIKRERQLESRLRHIETEYEEADLITVPSEFARQSFLAMGLSSTKVAVTPYGAELKDYYPVPKRDDTFRILFVGSVCLRKGVAYLLEAVARLKLRNAELCIRGVDSAESAQLLGMYRGSIPLRRVGPQPRDSMRDLFSQASVLVLPSVEDGFGLVIAQAMACGVPVIASRSSGGPELIAHGVNGFLVDARDSLGLSRDLEFLSENSDFRCELAEAARRTIQDLGGWRAYGDSVVASFNAARARTSCGAHLA